MFSQDAVESLHHLLKVAFLKFTNCGGVRESGESCEGVEGMHHHETIAMTKMFQDVILYFYLPIYTRGTSRCHDCTNKDSLDEMQAWFEYYESDGGCDPLRAPALGVLPHRLASSFSVAHFCIWQQFQLRKCIRVDCTVCGHGGCICREVWGHLLGVLPHPLATSFPMAGSYPWQKFQVRRCVWVDYIVPGYHGSINS